MALKRSPQPTEPEAGETPPVAQDEGKRPDKREGKLTELGVTSQPNRIPGAGDAPTTGAAEPRAAQEAPRAPDPGAELDEPASETDEDELAPDLVSDPLSDGNPALLESCTQAFFAAIKVRQAVTPDGEQLRRALRETLATAPGPESGAQMSDGEKKELTDWIENIEVHAFDPDKFVAGSFGRHLPAWEELLKDSKRESSKRVLKMLGTGVKPQFIGTAEADPRKRDQVRAMLARTVSPSEVDAKLDGQVPQQVEFANHRSFYDNAQFAVGEVVKMVENGTLHVYKPGDGKPKVVNPLGVVNLPKGRLVVNAKYVNLFCKRQPFKYETLREVLTFLTEKAYIASWDFKAGYYHVLISPPYRKYFGIKVGNVYLHYNAMCFGWSEACLLYTLLTQEAAKELRLRAVPVSSYLDDGITGSVDFWRCLWAMIFIIKVLTLLGAVFSWPKCHFLPQREGPWLGFLIDTVGQRFTVAPAKMDKLRSALQALLDATDVTPRELAKVAGKIISVSPAVLPAALYSRPLFAAIQGKLTWDDVFPTPHAAKETAQLFLDRLPEWNGRRWFPRCVTAEAGSDASELGFGGTIQIPGEGEDHRCGIPLGRGAAHVEHGQGDSCVCQSAHRGRGAKGGRAQGRGSAALRRQPRRGESGERHEQQSPRRKRGAAAIVRALHPRRLRRGGAVETPRRDARGRRS